MDSWSCGRGLVGITRGKVPDGGRIWEVIVEDLHRRIIWTLEMIAHTFVLRRQALDDRFSNTGLSGADNDGNGLGHGNRDAMWMYIRELGLWI